MCDSALSLYSKVLAKAWASASDRGLRAMAEVACRLAVSRAELKEPEIESAFDALLAGRYGDRSVRKSLADLIERLDRCAFDLQDAVEAGDASREEYAVAFGRARAAMCLHSALDERPRRGAERAIYEAIAAFDEDASTLEPLLLAACAAEGVDRR